MRESTTFLDGLWEVTSCVPCALCPVLCALCPVHAAHAVLCDRSYATAQNFGFKPCFFFIQETETSDLFLHEDDDDEDEDEDESRSWRR